MFKTLCASRKTVVLCLLALSAISVYAQNQPPSQPDPLRSFQYRSIGPYRGGRSAAVAGVPSQPFVYYYGATGGGVWKTTDGGINWESISDGSVFGTGSVGAIAVADSDPNVIYVGMGESPIRGNVSHGDGVYKSTDAGKTWKRITATATNGLPRGTMGRISFDWCTKANPKVIYASHKGFLPGPYEHRTALDEVVQMMGGLAYMTGRPGDPLRAGSSVNDIMGGMFGAIAILGAALLAFMVITRLEPSVLRAGALAGVALAGVAPLSTRFREGTNQVLTISTTGGADEWSAPIPMMGLVIRLLVSSALLCHTGAVSWLLAVGCGLSVQPTALISHESARRHGCPAHRRP